MSRNSVRFERRGGAQDEFVKIPLNYKSQLSFNPSSNHCKFSLARSSPILDSNQFLRIRTIAKINERGKQEFVNQSDPAQCGLPPRKYPSVRIGRSASTSREIERGKERSGEENWIPFERCFSSCRGSLSKTKTAHERKFNNIEAVDGIN